MAVIRLCLITADAPRLARFYCRYLGFRPMPSPEPQTLRLMLGQQELELYSPQHPSHASPPHLPCNDRRFQHFAIVVADMSGAFTVLRDAVGWTPISREGPQQLPASSGGVEAYKFRDPEGHPLELLFFPPDCRPPYWSDPTAALFLGIDHTALVVDDLGISMAFYAGLGFRPTSHTFNHGPEQVRLDDLNDVDLEVIRLANGNQPPQIELLAYHQPSPNDLGESGFAEDDILATRLVIQGMPPILRRDPSGHIVYCVC